MCAVVRYRTLGLLAQLVERCIEDAEVIGSIPIDSTSLLGIGNEITLTETFKLNITLRFVHNLGL